MSSRRTPSAAPLGLAGALAGAVAIAACGQVTTSVTGSHPPTSVEHPATQPAPPASSTVTTPPTPSGDLVGVPVVAAGGTTSTVFVLGTVRCGTGTCDRLWSGQGGRFEQVSVPPEGMTNLVFADAEDGYAFRRGPSGDRNPYATRDGGKSWKRVTFGGNLGAVDIVESAGTFSALLVDCSGTSCSNGYRVGRSAAGSLQWTSAPVPGTATYDPSTVAASIGAAGGDVWVDYPARSGDSAVELVESAGGSGPFDVVPTDLSAGNGTCRLWPMTAADLWALCPQGMTESFEHSGDGGRTFTDFWQPFQTGGIGFDPETAKIAYRYTGVGGGTVGGGPPDIPAGRVQQTADGGATFTDLAPLPADRGQPSSGWDLLFTGSGTVDGYLVVPKGGGSTYVLYDTVNGGDSWSQVTL